MHSRGLGELYTVSAHENLLIRIISCRFMPIFFVSFMYQYECCVLPERNLLWYFNLYICLWSVENGFTVYIRQSSVCVEGNFLDDMTRKVQSIFGTARY